MYPTFRQTVAYNSYTKFSWHISFDFVYKMYTKVCRNVVYISYTFCIHFGYISCIHLVQFLHSLRVVKIQSMISGLTKNYYITSSMQNISPVHQYIIEIKQILELQDLNGHNHI